MSQHQATTNHQSPVQQQKASGHKAPRSQVRHPNSSVTVARMTVAKAVVKRPACEFFQQGDCRFGRDCKNRHTSAPERESAERRRAALLKRALAALETLDATGPRGVHQDRASSDPGGAHKRPHSSKRKVPDPAQTQRKPKSKKAKGDRDMANLLALFGTVTAPSDVPS